MIAVWASIGVVARGPARRRALEGENRSRAHGLSRACGLSRARGLVGSRAGTLAGRYAYELRRALTEGRVLWRARERSRAVALSRKGSRCGALTWGSSRCGALTRGRWHCGALAGRLCSREGGAAERERRRVTEPKRERATARGRKDEREIRA